jgi:hypothetical protein
MNDVASQIHGEVDAYIARRVSPRYVDPGPIVESLKRILGQTAWGLPSSMRHLKADMNSFGLYRRCAGDRDLKNESWPIAAALSIQLLVRSRFSLAGRLL